jgi:glycosyltransferase involved in cell wall biosynthesis
MNVLHVIGSLDPKMGGLPRAVIGVAAAQARSGKDVSVLFFGDCCPQQILQEWTGGQEVPKRLSVLAIPQRFPVVKASAVRQALTSASPDWVQIHGLWEPILHTAMRWALANRVPYGVSPHSMGHPWHARHHVLAKLLVKHVLGVCALWKKAACLHALTRVEASHWRSIVGERISIFPNGIDPESDLGDSGASSPNLPSAPFVLFLGRLHAQKAPEILVEAFLSLSSQHPDLHLVLAGPDRGSQPKLEQMVKTAGEGGRIHFPGSLHGTDKWNALHRCAAFCLPSRAEGFSLAVLEASLVGAPCLLSRECGFPDLIRADGALEVPVDVAKLSACLDRVVSNPTDSREMGQRARSFLLEAYTWERIVDQFDAMVRRWT